MEYNHPNIIDSQMLKDMLTDFANRYGDQDLLDIINQWKLEKMGEKK